MNTNKMFRTVIMITVLTATFGIDGAEIKKDPSNTNAVLSDGAAWVGGVAPGADDVAVFDGTGGSYYLGANVEWSGILVTNAASKLIFLDDGSSLSLGANGLNLLNGAKYPMDIYCPIIATADQSWYTSNQKFVQVYGAVSGTGIITAKNIPYIGDAAFSIFSTNTVPGGFGARASTVILNEGSFFYGDVNTGWKHGLFLYFTQPKKWKDVFRTGKVINDGVIYFGRNEQAVDFSFESGDRIEGIESIEEKSNEARKTGSLILKNAAIQMTGGCISNNLIKIERGDFTQTGGSIYLRYAMELGITTTSGNKNMVVSGGSINADTLRAGTGNNAASPGTLAVSDGIVNFRTDLSLAAPDSDFNASPYGRLEITGGKVSAAQLRVGGLEAGNPIKNGFAFLSLEKGELAIGSGGIQKNLARWNAGLDADSSDKSWCDFRISAGTYRATDSQVNTVAWRLAGNATFQTDERAFVEQVAPLTGNGSLVKTGTGTLMLSPVNTYTGVTTIAAGTLAISASGNIPTPHSVWSADSLTGDNGSEVTSWTSLHPAAHAAYSFTKKTANAVSGSFTMPTLKENAINGHKAVVFDGVKNALVMSGGSVDDDDSTPAKNATNLTVALVLRAKKGAGNNAVWRHEAGIIGQAYLSPQMNWGIALNVDGKVAAGTMSIYDDANSTSAWSEQLILDEKPHVIIYTRKGGTSLSINVDGIRVSQADNHTAPFDHNRIILGCVENAGGSWFSHFGGEISEIRFYKNQSLSLEEEHTIGKSLAVQYGCAYTVPVSIVDAPATNEETLPPPSGLWAADNLSEAAGAEVSSWNDSVTNGSFNIGIANAIYGTAGSSKPSISPVMMNGHKAVRFDGTKKNVLGMTGGTAENYVGTNMALTVAMVIRPIEAGRDYSRSGWPYASGILGMGYIGSDSVNKWGIAFTGVGEICGGIRDGSSWTITSYSQQRLLHDSEPHVIIWTCSTNITLNVDGYASTRTNITTLPRTPARACLGRIEPVYINGGHQSGGFFTGDIAEFRFYKDTTLTPAQQKQLGLALARKYGAETVGYYSDPATLFQSREVHVGEDGCVALLGAGLRLNPGQVFSGNGDVMGNLVVGTHAVLAATMTESLTIQSLVLEPGAILQHAFSADGKTCATTTVGSLALPAGEVVVDLHSETGKLIPNGVILRWTDECIDAGVTWRITGGKQTSKIVVDPKNKTIQVKTTGQLLLMIQ